MQTNKSDFGYTYVIDAISFAASRNSRWNGSFLNVEFQMVYLAYTVHKTS